MPIAKTKQKVIERSTGDWMYVTLQAHPEEVAKWRELAKADDRSLSWWIRNVLNKTVGAAEPAAEMSEIGVEKA
jgi:hypothetical protein